MYKILIAEKEDFSAEAIDILKKVGNVENLLISNFNLTESLRNYDVLIFRLGFKITREDLPFSPKCKIIATPVTGLDHIDLVACKEKGIQIISLKGEFEFLKKIRATAELTIGLTLALLRHIPSAVQHVKKGMWNRDIFRGTEIFEKTVGIIGLGRLGSIVAEYFQIMGANVIGFDPRPDFPHLLAKRMDSIEDVFIESDIISLHISYNEKTHHLIGEKQFTMAARKPYLINTSRGAIIEEGALIKALDKNQIAGAALDVIQNEHNISKYNHLIQYANCNENLMIVPHIGGNTFESFEKTEKFIAEKIVTTLKH